MSAAPWGSRWNGMRSCSASSSASSPRTGKQPSPSRTRSRGRRCPPRHGPSGALRLSAVRGFASWLNAADSAHQVPPRRLIPYGSRAIVPYLYSDEEIGALAREVGRLSGRLRAATFGALIRLLAVTGMRVGEAIRLDRSDYDAASGALTVRGTKFGKSRQLPLHPTAITGLNKYLRLCSELMPVPQAPALLLTARGCRLRYERTWEIFRGLTVSAGLKPRSPACRPRIHDLRHYADGWVMCPAVAFPLLGAAGLVLQSA
jgi:integrase